MDNHSHRASAFIEAMRGSTLRYEPPPPWWKRKAVRRYRRKWNIVRLERELGLDR